MLNVDALPTLKDFGTFHCFLPALTAGHSFCSWLEEDELLEALVGQIMVVLPSFPSTPPQNWIFFPMSVLSLEELGQKSGRAERLECVEVEAYTIVDNDHQTLEG